MDEIVIPLTVEPLDEGGYLATSPVWDDVLAQGRTVAETLEIARDVVRKLIESYRAHGDPLPPGVVSLETSATTMSLHIAVATSS